MGRHAASARVVDGITVPSSATGNEVRIKRLRTKFAITPHKRPSSVPESDWAIFTACVHEKRALTEVSRSLGMPPTRLRDTLARVEALMETHAVTPDRPLEELQLSVRARNALRRLGCSTVADVQHLNFNGSLRQLGSKTRSEVLEKLSELGFRPTGMERPPVSEVGRIARGLDRVQTRMHSTFESIMREIRVLQERIERLGE